MKKMNKKGFTLVEIMIVVAIIGLLAAIGIPSFQKARASSITKSKENNARIVQSAGEQFAMEVGRASGAVTAAEYGAYIKGGVAALKVGEESFLSPDVSLADGAAALTAADCYTAAAAAE